MPDRDYFTCAEADVAGTTSDLTIVGGKPVYGAGDFAHYDQGKVPPAMPDWSPVRAFGGYAAWGDHARQSGVLSRTSCGCKHACDIHGHCFAVSLRSIVESLPGTPPRVFYPPQTSLRAFSGLQPATNP